MSNFLFKDFDPVSPAAWKQKIQVDLKGADYNETLLWKTDEGIVVKPFYTKEDRINQEVSLPNSEFNICQSIFVDDEKIANKLAIDALERGANAIQFIANKKFDCDVLVTNLTSCVVYFQLNFLYPAFIKRIKESLSSFEVYFQIDPIGHLAETGNWFSNLKNDFESLDKIVAEIPNSLSINISLYQNAGATIVQQLAYGLAHANEYLNKYNKKLEGNLQLTLSVGGNYFFEIAKIRAFRILFATLTEEYGFSNTTVHVFTKPSVRNKTIYDYNVNMLRTTSECMSAVLGSSNTVSNISYDCVYHKSNEFGERISRNQLLILKNEANFIRAQEIPEGSYYIESIANQLAEKALEIFKQIEKGGGFLAQLKSGIIQRKIKESADREQEKFEKNILTLVGTNKSPNPKDRMKDDLELHPFVKQNKIKTLVPPIIQRRLSQEYEKLRLDKESKIT